MPPDGRDRRRFTVPAMYVAAALAPCLVFVMPLFVPSAPTQAVSASYLAGFNNGVAIVSAVALSVAVFLLSWWGRDAAARFSEEASDLTPLPHRLVAGVVAATAVVQAFAGWLILSSHQRNLSDAGYIIEQATVLADTGRQLYTQVEFAYGPLLVLPVVWVSRTLHCSVGAAYFGLLVLESAIGLRMLAYVLDRLPIRPVLRNVGFVLLALAALTPHFGLNYTMFRFASPFAVLLFSTRERSAKLCAWRLTAGLIFELMISPELALAMSVGVLAFGLVRAYQSGWRWLIPAFVPVAALGVLLLTLARPYLRMAALFSRGAFNLPVGPYPHVLLLLVALIWLVPRALGRTVDLRDERSAALLAVYAVSLAFMPAALGRCDPLHVMFNGTGILVLALVALSTASDRARKIWIVCLGFVVLWDQRVNDRYFRIPDTVAVREAILHRLPARTQDGVSHAVGHLSPYLGFLLSREVPRDLPISMPELTRFVGTAPVVTPMEISPTVEAQLRQAHLYSPGFFAFWMDTANPHTEEMVVAHVNAHHWMLLPSWWEAGGLQLPRGTGLFQGLNLHYRQRRPLLYCPRSIFTENLEQNWTVVWSFGSYLLYEHTGSAPVPPEAANDLSVCATS